MINEKEFELFCNEIAKVAREHGISYDTITTILAKAIKNREDVLTKPQNVTVVRTQQMVYGPPPRQEAVEVFVSRQPVYGPPPKRK